MVMSSTSTADNGIASTAGDAEINNAKKFDLEKCTELRFEVADDPVIIRLVQGKAELFGTELRLEQKYTFKKGDKVAIFTYHGCKIKMIGKPEVDYVSAETPMNFYINISNALEGARVKAATDNEHGPNVLVAGPPDVGKSTFCRILLNYAVRSGRSPVYVDLDLGQGSISIPGSIGKFLLSPFSVML